MWQVFERLYLGLKNNTNAIKTKLYLGRQNKSYDGFKGCDANFEVNICFKF